jgi:predicted O-linked N-acetylglucosamine transferase (SPINDLY family)
MAVDPRFTQAQAALRAGQLPQALALIDALLRQTPDHAAAWNLAGVVCQVQREYGAAIRYFQRSLELQPSPGVLVNLGFALQKDGQPEAALQAYTMAAQRDPTLALAWQKLAGLQEALGRREAALASYRRAVAVDPGDLKSLGDGLYLRRHLADWRPGDTLAPAQLLASLASAARSDFSPGLLLSLPEASPAAHRAAGHRFARSQWGALLDGPPLATTARARSGRLRVGYLSADFRGHAVAYLVTDVMAAHDRANVDVFAYAYRSAPANDPARAAVVAAVDAFVDIDALDDRAAAQRIRDDGIDVLVDLTGYTGSGRLGINALRPAPVIATWIGYVGTLGEPRLADYVIGDAIATPLATAAHFSEALALLPHGYQPNLALRPLAPPPMRSEAGLPAEAVVFCSFNQTYKLNPPLWDDWCAILRGVPDSVLWLPAPRDPLAQRHLHAEARARGVAPERLVFAPLLPLAAHHARLALADLALDTYPYNSGTTASDALRAGVPLLTFAGETFVGRMASSLLHHAGLPECVAKDRDGFVALAIALGTDHARRASLRQRVRAAVPASRLFRPDLMAADLERLYAAMHANALAGRREHIVLDDEAAS